jgi:hypothetical protein
LMFRLATYALIILNQFGIIEHDGLCINPYVTTIFSNIPSYLYIYSGLCQMFIVI